MWTQHRSDIACGRGGPVVEFGITTERGAPMVQKILVPIDGSDNSLQAFDQAVEFAKKNGSSIGILFVVDLRKTSLPVYYAGAAYEMAVEHIYIPVDQGLRDFFGKVKDDLNSFGRKNLDDLVRKAESAGVEAMAILKEGFPSEIIMEEAHGYGLVVMGQHGEHKSYSRRLAGSTLEELVHHSPRPVTVVPGAATAIDTVLFLYDGSRAAERAVQFWVNGLSAVCKEMTVLSVCEEDDPCLPNELQFLQEHGVKAEVVERKGSVMKAVGEVVADRAPDLILAGATSHEGLKEMFLGSTSQHLVRNTPVPLLIVH
jgi:nucleotide-binding universal stress UspA family protein